MGLLALTFVLSFATGTLFSGIVPRLAVVGVCVKGALSVFRYCDIEREIADAKSDEGTHRTAEPGAASNGGPTAPVEIPVLPVGRHR